MRMKVISRKNVAILVHGRVQLTFTDKATHAHAHSATICRSTDQSRNCTGLSNHATNSGYPRDRKNSLLIFLNIKYKYNVLTSTSIHNSQTNHSVIIYTK